MAAIHPSSSAIVLREAPDTDIGSKDARHTPVQAMELELAEDMVDELLASIRAGKPPQVLFGRSPQLKCGDKVHLLQTGPANHRFEVYRSGGPAGEHDLEFAGLINHSLAVQKAAEVTSGVDTALEQLKSQMASLAELKEANKTIVGNATTSVHPGGHRRFPSKNLKSEHLRPSSNLNSPLRSIPASPAMAQSTPQSRGDVADSKQRAAIKALRYSVVHLLAMGPRSEDWIRHQTRSSHFLAREALGKAAKKNDKGEYILTDKAFRDIVPWSFPYLSADDRQKAIDNAIRAFDRLRLPKDDKLWQILLPSQERGQGKCLSRLTVRAPTPKPSTPLQKFTKLTEKKQSASQKVDPKDSDKEGKKVKQVKEKPEKKPARKQPEKPLAKAEAAKKSLKAEAVKKAAKAETDRRVNSEPEKKTQKPEKSKVAAPARQTNTKTAATEAQQARKKPAAEDPSVSTRPKPRPTPREAPTKERANQNGRSVSKPTVPNTKPKNPSPLSASPPVNASDFKKDHPVHKALAAGPSPVKNTSQLSGSLKRKAMDLDNDTRESDSPRKLTKTESTVGGASKMKNVAKKGKEAVQSTGLKRQANDFLETDMTPFNTQKRKAHDLPDSEDRLPASKQRKVDNINTSTPRSNTPTDDSNSPGQSSTATTSPTVESALTWNQTIELARKFEEYYPRYRNLHKRLWDSPNPPTDAERKELMQMHTLLANMKRDIYAGAIRKDREDNTLEEHNKGST